MVIWIQTMNWHGSGGPTSLCCASWWQKGGLEHRGVLSHHSSRWMLTSKQTDRGNKPWHWIDKQLSTIPALHDGLGRRWEERSGDGKGQIDTLRLGDRLQPWERCWTDSFLFFFFFMKKYVAHFKGLLLNPISGPEGEDLQYRQRWRNTKGLKQAVDV